MRRPKPARPSRRPNRFSLPATQYSALEPRQLLFGDLDFAHQLGDDIEAIAQDSSGNLYFGGTFFGTQDFDPGPGTDQLGSGGTATFVVKLDPQGAFVWAEKVEAPFFGDLVVDGNDNLYITGGYTVPPDLDPGPGTSTASFAGGIDAYVVRWDADGNFVWGKSFGGAGNEIFSALTLDSLGNVYAAGEVDSPTIDLDPGAGTVLHTTAGGSDIMAVRLDPAGNHLWSDTAGGTSNDDVNDIAVDRFGSLVLTGSYFGSTDLDPTGGVDSHTSSGASDIFLTTWDFAGNLQWSRTWGGSSSDDAYGLTLSPTGDIYVCGAFSSTGVDFDPGSATFLLGSGGAADAWLSKFDSQGQFRWAQKYGSDGNANNQIARTVTLDDRGTVYLGGTFAGSVDFDPGIGTRVLYSTGSFGLALAVNPVPFVLALSEQGTFRWAQGMTESGAGSVSSGNLPMLVDGDGHVVLAGRFSGTIDFDPGPRHRNLTASGNDGFLVRLTNDFLVEVPLTGAADYVLRKSGDLVEVFDDALNIVVDSRIIAELEGIEVRGVDGFADKLTVDFAHGGSFGFRNGIRFSGGSGAGDTFRVAVDDKGAMDYRPAATADGQSFIGYLPGSLKFTGAESLVVDGLDYLSVTTPNSQDALTLSAATGIGNSQATRISGTSGGVPMVPVTGSNIIAILIGLATSDTAGPSSNDTVTVNAGALQAAGLRDLEISLGRGADVVTMNDADLGLPQPGGQFLVRGGGGVDRMVVSGNADWWINDLRVTSSLGGKISFDDLERATVTGGASANTITAVGFSGPLILQGLGSDDTIWGGPSNDTIQGGLGNDRLYGMAGNDSIIGEDGLDRLFGGDDHDTLLGGLGIDILSGQAGDDTLNGEGGLDLYLFDGTSSAEVLHLQFVDAANQRFVRRPRGLSVELERDALVVDTTDQMFIQALDGDDQITIDTSITNVGSVDGGAGADTCTAPTSWTRTSCP